MNRQELLEEYQRLSDHIDAFNRMIDAWERCSLREYLWLCSGVDIHEHETHYLMKHFCVTRQKLLHAFYWLRRWGWQVERLRFTVYKLTPPADYRPLPPRPGQQAHPKRKKVKLTKPGRTLSADYIAALQAEGYTQAQIAKHYGYHYSTSSQILRRARLREQQEAT